MSRHGESVAPCIKTRVGRLQTWNCGRHQAACLAHGDRDILIEEDPRSGVTTRVDESQHIRRPTVRSNTDVT
jgi:hypothetical protein